MTPIRIGGTKRGRASARRVVELAVVAAMTIAIADVASAIVAAQVASGLVHRCALSTSGGLKCWGQNLHGQLGAGDTGIHFTPVDVVGLTSGVASVSVGYRHTCAVTTSGGLKCWGSNSRGQLGTGTTTSHSAPVDVTGLTSGVAAVVAGGPACAACFEGDDRGTSSCALTTAGGVKCWGSNSKGQLGDGTTTDSLVPVDVVGLSSSVTSLALYYGHACAVTAAGGVKCWGFNSHGQLGDGGTTDRSTPVDVVGLTSGVAEVTAGQLHTCALTAAGGVKCWGIATQLGNGGPSSPTPVDPIGLSSGVTKVVAGLASNAALMTSGGLKHWGFSSLPPMDLPYFDSGVASMSIGGELIVLTTAGQLRNWFSNWPAGCLFEYGDADGDSVCDQDDPCTGGAHFSSYPRPTSRLVLTRINTETTPGNDQLVLSGTKLTLPAGSSFADLDPVGQGARIVLGSPEGITAEVVLASGVYNGPGTAGWMLSSNGKEWKFTDSTGPNGRTVSRVKLKDLDGRPLTFDRTVEVSVRLTASDLPLGFSDVPVAAHVILGDATAAAAGWCGQALYTGYTIGSPYDRKVGCAFNGSGNTLTCRL